MQAKGINMEESSLFSWGSHLFAGSALAGFFSGVFPSIVLVLAAALYALQIWDNRRVQTWLSTRRLRKIARLKLEQERLEAVELVLHPKNRTDILPAKIAAAELLEEAKAEAKRIVDAARQHDSRTV
jgi:hypothetical protein